jgi:acyl-coenzyme A thioesterase PaaI-like protein
MAPVDTQQLRQAARACFGCGYANPHGLQLKFDLVDGITVATFHPRPEHQGYPGLLHGGLISVILDEAIGWTTYGRGVPTVTGKLSVRMREPVPVDAPLEVRAWITQERRRWTEARGELRSLDGRVFAEAEGIMMPIPDALAAQMRLDVGPESRS